MQLNFDMPLFDADTGYSLEYLSGGSNALLLELYRGAFVKKNRLVPIGMMNDSLPNDFAAFIALRTKAFLLRPTPRLNIQLLDERFRNMPACLFHRKSLHILGPVQPDAGMDQ